MTKIGFRIGKVTSRKRGKAPEPSICGRLEQLAGHLRQPRVDGDRDERNRAPDDQRRDHAEADDRVREPVVLDEVAEVELREHVVEDAVLVVRHPEPELRRDHDRHRPGEHERGRDRASASPGRAPCSRSAISVPSTSVRTTLTAVKSTERRTTRQNSPSPRIAVKLSSPTDAALVGDQLRQAVVLEREPDEEVERVAEDRDDHDHRRRDQRVRHRPPGERAPRSRRRCRRSGPKAAPAASAAAGAGTGSLDTRPASSVAIRCRCSGSR